MLGLSKQALNALNPGQQIVNASYVIGKSGWLLSACRDQPKF